MTHVYCNIFTSQTDCVGKCLDVSTVLDVNLIISMKTSVFSMVKLSGTGALPFSCLIYFCLLFQHHIVHLCIFTTIDKILLHQYCLLSFQAKSNCAGLYFISVHRMRFLTKLDGKLLRNTVRKSNKIKQFLDTGENSQLLKYKKQQNNKTVLATICETEVFY